MDCAEVDRKLSETVAPHANLIDRSTPALRRALAVLLDQGWMCLRRPTAYGGPEVTEPEFREFQECVASYSGALAFLQTQHQSAVALISRGANEDLKQRFLPRMHTRQGLTGIGFSQLRRPGPPVLRAEAVDGGYRLNGSVPWATGHRLFPHLLLAGSLEDGRSIFGLTPFRDAERDGGSIRFSQPMKLAAMESARTVSAELQNWFLPDRAVVSLKPPQWIHRNDMINITLQGFFAIGCARAGVRLVEQAAAKSGATYVRAAAVALGEEIGECRKAMSDAQQADGELTTEAKLRTRAWAIDLAMRCAHAAITASSGAANLASHAAQRVLREALVFTVSAQTAPIMEATLTRLVQRGGNLAKPEPKPESGPSLDPSEHRTAP